MKRMLSFALAILSVLSLSLCAVADSVTIDMDTTYQTIDGFGASYTWYGDFLTTNAQAETGYDWIFNEAGFNILRFRDLHHVGNEYENAKNGYPAYKAYYDAAVARGVEPIVLVTSWGQYDRDLPFVAFNELSDKGYSYYTLAKDENGEYMYDELAEFCVKSIQYFFDAGIPVHYFSISNEIELQERHIDEQGKAREEAGFFIGPEETDDYCAYWKAHIAVYEAFKEAFGEWAPTLLGAETMAGYADLLGSYLDPVIENCPESLEIIGHHLYGTEQTPSNFAKVYDRFSDYRIWQTEYYMNDYFEQARVLIDELTYENINAYLYWNGVWIPDTGNCLIEVGSDAEHAEVKRIGNHYIMTHFSKYIKQGYQRVELKTDGDLMVCGFKSPDESELVVVALNTMESEDTDLNIDLSELEVLDSFVLQSFEGENRFAHDYLVEMGEFGTGLFMPSGSLATVVFSLEGNPDYVAPEKVESVNPFIKQPSAFNPIVIIIVAVLALVTVIISIVLISKKKSKNKEN